MNAICLVLDRLHVGYLGPLGNTWIDTPCFNRLAAEGFVFDQAWIDSPALGDLCRAGWSGLHPRQPALEASRPLPALLAERGIRSALITDEPAVARHPLAGTFGSCWELEAPTPCAPARQMDQTHLARCFAWLVECLDRLPEPFLAWCHLRALEAPWDAPQTFRQSYRQEGDPAPLDTAEVPCRTLPQDFDPDELLPITQAYAGQVTLLDQCLGGLLEWLAGGRPGPETLLVVISARGIPLGEHRRVGPGLDTLHAEVTHVPLFLRLPGAAEAAGRSGALVRPADVAATLLEFFGVRDVPLCSSAHSLLALVRGEVEGFRDRHLIVADAADGGPADTPSARGQRALITPAWYYYLADRPELYVLPDDFWQANDVADRCPEIIALLEDALQQCEAALAAGQTELPPLDPQLLEPP